MTGYLKVLCSAVLSRFCHVLRMSRGSLQLGAHQAPLSMGLSGQEHGNGLPCLPPGDLPNPAIFPLASGLLTTSAAWEARVVMFEPKFE